LTNKTETEKGVEIMKLILEVASEKMCYIINRLLEEGVFPREWKEAIVIPIPKVRRTNRIEEFRPINKLSVYRKDIGNGGSQTIGRALGKEQTHYRMSIKI